MGLEPTTLGTTTRCSNRLSYIYHIKNKWSGREDSNLRPPGPKPGALTRLRYAPTKKFEVSQKVDGIILNIFNFVKGF